MAIIKIPKKKTSSPNRKAGTRAGLSKPAIVVAAAKLIESVGANGFSLRKLAKALGVGPTTIHFHSEGGVGSVFSAVAQEALAGVTRPFKPKDEPAAYLGELLLKILQALHARPVVAKLVVLQLSSNAVLHPLLAERLLLALGALGAPTEAGPIMFQRAMGVIFEMILAGCGRSGAAESRIAGVRPYTGRAMCDHISQERQRRRLAQSERPASDARDRRPPLGIRFASSPPVAFAATFPAADLVITRTETSAFHYAHQLVLFGVSVAVRDGKGLLLGLSGLLGPPAVRCPLPMSVGFRILGGACCGALAPAVEKTFSARRQKRPSRDQGLN